MPTRNPHTRMPEGAAVSANNASSLGGGTLLTTTI